MYFPEKEGYAEWEYKRRGQILVIFIEGPV